MEYTKSKIVLLANNANNFLIGLGLLSFVFLGYFHAVYYYYLFENELGRNPAMWAAVALAFLIQGGRFTFMMSSASDLITKNWRGFKYGFVASLLIIGYELLICTPMGNHFGGEIFTNIFRVIAVFGALIELRLCLLLHGAEIETEESTQSGNVKTGGNQNQSGSSRP